MNADDQRLITECLNGQVEAFGELVRRYQARLYNSVYRLLDHADDAQDVVQDAFLSAYQSLASFNGRSEFFTWLYRIAFNTAISLKRKKRVVLSLEPGQNDSQPGVEPPDDSAGTRPGEKRNRTPHGPR